MKTKLSLLEQLPEVILCDFLAKKYLNPISVSRLSRTNGFLNNLFKEDLKKSFIKHFLQNVIEGNKDEVITILEKFQNNQELLSSLLLTQAMVIDRSKRKISGTALQLAICGHDLALEEDKEELCEIIYRFMRQLPNGCKHADDQLAVIQKREIPSAIMGLFPKIMHAILNNDLAEVDKCVEILEAFLCPKEVLVNTNYFDLRLFRYAYDAMFENLPQNPEFCFFGYSKNAQKKIYGTKVFGTLEKYFPSCYAQILNSGIYRTLNTHDFSRDLIINDTGFDEVENVEINWQGYYFDEDLGKKHYYKSENTIYVDRTSGHGLSGVSNLLGWLIALWNAQVPAIKRLREQIANDLNQMTQVVRDESRPSTCLLSSFNFCKKLGVK